MFRIEARIVPFNDFTKLKYSYLPSAWFNWSKKYKTHRAALQALAAFNKQSERDFLTHITFRETYQTKVEYRIVHYYPELN